MQIPTDLIKSLISTQTDVNSIKSVEMSEIRSTIQTAKYYY